MADPHSVEQYRLAVPEHRRGIIEEDGDQPAFPRRVASLRQCTASEERLLVEVHREPKPDLVWIVGEPHVVSPRPEASLEPE